MNEDFREEIMLYSERLAIRHKELLDQYYNYDVSEESYNKFTYYDFIDKNNFKDLYYMKSINKKEDAFDLDEYLDKYENIPE